VIFRALVVILTLVTLTWITLKLC